MGRFDGNEWGNSGEDPYDEFSHRRKKIPEGQESNFDYMSSSLAHNSAVAQLGRITLREREDARLVFLLSPENQDNRSALQDSEQRCLIFAGFFKSIENALITSYRFAHAEVVQRAIQEARAAQLKHLEANTSAEVGDGKPLQPDRADSLRECIEEIASMYSVECAPPFELHFQNFGQPDLDVAA